MPKPLQDHTPVQLYIVSVPGYSMFYKVGVSRDVRRRLTDANTWHPMGVMLLYVYDCPDAKAVEAEVHRYFHSQTDSSGTGEWVCAPLKRIVKHIEATIAQQEKGENKRG